MVFDLSQHGVESVLTPFYHSIGGKEPGKWALRDRTAASLSEVRKITNCLRAGETDTWVESLADSERWGTGPPGGLAWPFVGTPQWRMTCERCSVCVLGCGDRLETTAPFSRWHRLAVMNAKLIGLIEIHRQEESPLTSSAVAAACLEEINLITRSVRHRDRGLAPISILMNLCAWGISWQEVITYYLSSPSSCVLFVQLGNNLSHDTLEG